MNQIVPRDIYLSFHHSDAQIAEKIELSLKRRGFSVKLNYDQETINSDELRSSRLLLLGITQDYVGFSWPLMEKQTVPFRDTGLTGRLLIPLLLEDIEVPDALSHYAYIDLAKDERTGVSALLSACQKLLGDRNATPKRRDSKKIQPLASKFLRSIKTGREDGGCAVRFANGRSTFVSCDLFGNITLWSPTSYKKIGFTKKPTKFAFEHAANPILSASPSGNYLATSFQGNHRTIVYEVPGTFARKSCELPSFDQAFSNLAFSGDDLRAITVEYGKVRIWNLQEGSSASSVSRPASDAQCICWIDEFAIALVGTTDGEIEKLHLDTGELATSRIGHMSAVTAVLHAASKGIVASASLDQTIKIWSFDSLELLASLGHVDKWRSHRRIDVMSMKPRKLSAVLS